MGTYSKQDYRLNNNELAQRATDKYYLLFNSINQGFCIIEMIWDEQGNPRDYRFLEVNAAFERQTNIRNAKGRTMREIEPDHEAHWFQIYGEVAKTKKTVQFEQKAEPLIGGWYEVYAFPITREDDNQVGILFNDITQRKKEEEKQAYLIKLMDVLRPLANPVEIKLAATHILGRHLSVDRAMYVEYVQKDGEDLWLIEDFYHTPEYALPSGYYPVKKFGRDSIAFLTGVPVIVNDMMNDTGIDEQSKENLRSIATYAYIGFPYLKEGKCVAVMGVHSATPRVWTTEEIELLRETAERTWADVERAKAQREKEVLLKHKEEFIGIASHELKTPVTSIKTYAQLLHENLLENGDAANAVFVEKLNRQIDRLTDLIIDLLDTTRIEEGRLVYQMKSFDLNVLIAERTEEMQRIAGNRKITLLLNAYHPIMADRERIAQVLTNLLSNAIKYSPDGTEIKVNSEQNEHEVIVRVADAGIGIPERYHDKIFDRFYRVSDDSMCTYPGIGLGLYISAEIIRSHGGNISVKSKEGQGAVFQFTLPAINS
jgi:signal transduction histidine kinase